MTAKQLALTTLKATGIVRLARDSRWRRQRLAILCYHSLARADEHAWAPALFLSVEHFSRRLAWLDKRGYQVVSLGDGLSMMRRGELPERAVAITFDDGTADFCDLAWPLLEARKMPATVYWTTYYSEQRQPAFQMMCDYLLWKGRTRRLAARTWGQTGERDIATGPQRAAVLQEIAAFRTQSQLTPQTKLAWLEQLATALAVDFQEILAKRILQVMTPEEAARVAARGADVQLHTHRHRTPVDRELFRREILDNRERIEAATGHTPKHFCYPSGKLAAEFFPWLQELGVESAVTCESGLAASGDNPYLLPRIVDTMTLSELELEGWLSGARLLLGKPQRAGEIIGQAPE